jgi:cellobiose-specific phosphotransferase system component IIC
MISLIYRVFMISFGVFNVGFSRVFSGIFAAGGGVFIISRDIIIFLISKVIYYPFFRKITSVYFDFSLMD